MSLKHAILVILEKEPAAGYDLLQKFRESLGYFWNAKHQQIYKQLKQLLDDQLITVKMDHQENKPDKKIYSITTQGQAELVSWLSTPSTPSKINDVLLVKIYSANASNLHLINEELHSHIALHQKTLSTLLEIELTYKGLSEELRHQYRFPYLTLRRGILIEQAWLTWANEAIQLFKK